MRCNKCKGRMVGVDIVEEDRTKHHMEVCEVCGNIYGSRKIKLDLGRLKVRTSIERG
ncbi:hypothetical protein [Dethiothermospora halolimnae]|uniref:hypothetical protein n=1 Tax=Dethiothermospora halolimnae TaxID=3114390 RepID=UPI003CCB9F04